MYLECSVIDAQWVIFDDAFPIPDTLISIICFGRFSLEKNCFVIKCDWDAESSKIRALWWVPDESAIKTSAVDKRTWDDMIFVAQFAITEDCTSECSFSFEDPLVVEDDDVLFKCNRVLWDFLQNLHFDEVQFCKKCPFLR